MLFIGNDFEKYTTLDTDMLYTGIDIPVSYRYVYLEENSPDPIKSEWTELRPHEFAREHNVRILKTSRQLGENPVEVVQDLPKNEFDDYHNLPVKDFVYEEDGSDVYLTLEEQESLKKIRLELENQKKKEKELKESLINKIKRQAKECILKAIKNEDKNNPLDDKSLCKIVNKELNLDFTSSFITSLRNSEKIPSHKKRKKS